MVCETGTSLYLERVSRSCIETAYLGHWRKGLYESDGKLKGFV
jgi:hypothetical protein